MDVFDMPQASGGRFVVYGDADHLDVCWNVLVSDVPGYSNPAEQLRLYFHMVVDYTDGVYSVTIPLTWKYHYWDPPPGEDGATIVYEEVWYMYCATDQATGMTANATDWGGGSWTVVESEVTTDSTTVLERRSDAGAMVAYGDSQGGAFSRYLPQYFFEISEEYYAPDGDWISLDDGETFEAATGLTSTSSLFYRTGASWEEGDAVYNRNLDVAEPVGDGTLYVHDAEIIGTHSVLGNDGHYQPRYWWPSIVLDPSIDATRDSRAPRATNTPGRREGAPIFAFRLGSQVRRLLDRYVQSI